ncbi:MAG: DUF2062 domain-containing protein [Rhodospirillaceae bacterium]
MHKRVQEFFVPSSGWKRATRYMGYRVARLPGTPSSIAMGFACGAAASITPLVGFHFLLAAFLALVLRGNLIASAIGTAVGNPWTFPFIWLGTFEVGGWILGMGYTGAMADSINFGKFFGYLWNSIVDLDGALFVNSVWPIWKPMFVGALPLAILTWAICYWPIKRAVHGYQHRRAVKRRAKRLQAQEVVSAVDAQEPETATSLPTEDRLDAVATADMTASPDSASGEPGAEVIDYPAVQALRDARAKRHSA